MVRGSDSFCPELHCLPLHPGSTLVSMLNFLLVPSPVRPEVVCVCVCAHACVCSVAQSCPTLCNPMDCNPPGSSVHGIFQARIQEHCHSLLQEIFLTQGLNSRLLSLLHWQAHFLPLSCLGNPRPGVTNANSTGARDPG